MSDTSRGPLPVKAFRFRDFLVILLCLAGAAIGLFLFRQDLFHTINMRDEKPVGTIIIKNNIVQRRLRNRVIWDRLFTESPVYLGDLIRVADLSAASLNIDDNGIDLNENTLIRIQMDPEGGGFLQIEMTQGNMNLNTAGGSIVLNLMGRRLKAGPGTVLNASAGEDGMVLAISEGELESLDGGADGEEAFPARMPAGAVIALDAGGRERAQGTLVVTRPLPYARCLKSGPEDLIIPFAWSRINLDPDAALILEIARDRNFAQIFLAIENLDNAAEAALGEGLWHWRLLYRDAVLSAGQISIIDASGPELISPAGNRLFRYTTSPQLSFQWSKKEDASHYILEAGNTVDFSNPLIRVETDALSLRDSRLGPGTWYWRVMPVFPPAYEGAAEFSPAASFRIEEGEEPEELPWPAPVVAEAAAAPVLEEPQPEPAPKAAPPPPPAAPPAQNRPASPPPARPPEPARAVPPPESPPARPAQIAAPPPPARPPEPARAAPPPESPPARPAQIAASPPPARSPEPVRAAPPPESPPAPPAQIAAPPPLFQAPPQSAVPEMAAEPKFLPAPENRLPLAGQRIGINELRTQRSIIFRWSTVPGANAYIFSLYRITENGPRLIVSTPPRESAEWKLETISALDRGAFTWRVEAVRLGPDGTIVERGTMEDYSFILDIPSPRQPSVRVE